MNPTAKEEQAAVLIPVYNGGDRLVDVVRRLLPLGLPVWISDDGSTDGAPLAAAREGARLVRSERRRGKGAALRRGLCAVLPEGCRWVIFMDGDGQHLPEEVPLFLEAMRPPLDLLVGTRVHQRDRFPRHRLVTNLAGSAVLCWMTGQAVPDTQCGFRALAASVLGRMELESDGFEIETEILLKALRLGARWAPVPVSAVYDGQGSHYRPVHDTYRICMAALRYVRG
jgi:glycosyltransferase involved in cell wall biosynthesis